MSRYLEVPGIVYNKTEDLTDFSSFDYLLAHDKEEGGDAFEVFDKETCFSGMNWKKGKMILADCVYLLKKKV